MPQDPVLDEAHAAFIQGGVSMYVASRGKSDMPSLVRALGCRVSPDRRRVTVFVARSQAMAVLEDMRRTGAIAVVFTQPSTHRSIQLKGHDAAPAQLEASDPEIMAALVKAFAVELGPLGYPAALVETMLACDTDDLVAIAFTPDAAFSQTPGARAGAPLGK